MTSRVKAKAKLLKIQAKDDIHEEARQMAIACISAAELFIVKMFDWIIAEYQSMLQVSGAGVDLIQVSLIGNSLFLLSKLSFVSSNFFRQKDS